MAFELDNVDFNSALAAQAEHLDSSPNLIPNSQIDDKGEQN